MDPFGQYVANLVSASTGALTRGALRRHEEMSGSDRLAGPLELEHEIRLTLTHLSESLASARPELFEQHIAWLKVAYASRDIPLRLLSDGLHCISEELQASLPDAALGLALEHVTLGEQTMWSAPDKVPSELESNRPYVELARRYLLALLENRADDAVDLVREEVRAGMDVRDVHEHVLAVAQNEMGRMWQMNELHVAEEHVGSRITERVLVLLAEERPRVESNGRRLIATSVTGNTHELGLRVVADHFAMAGWEIVMLGADMPILDIARGVRDFEADLVAVSANILHVRTTAGLVATLRSLTETATVPILVGGRPFSMVEDLWKVVGADGTGRNGREAVEVGERLVARGQTAR